jgi:hypothetical protein
MNMGLDAFSQHRDFHSYQKIQTMNYKCSSILSHLLSTAVDIRMKKDSIAAL